MAVFVLVHGAWAGGWCWKHVTPLLRAAGHDVYPVTLTGLGERAHLASPSINLDTHIRDVTATIEYEELDQVVLVGHSYGGTVITGVLGSVPQRIKRAIYIDASVPAAGECVLDEMSPAIRDFVNNSPDVHISSPPPIGDSMAWWRSKVAPHPLDTWRTPLRTPDPASTNIPRTFIACTRSDNHRDLAESLRTRAGWRVLEIDSDHFPMVRAPEKLAELMLSDTA